MSEVSPQGFEVLTLFPDAVEGFLRAGLIGKALERELIEVHCTDPRGFTHDRHRTVDDSPYGGGPGMVMKIGPVVEALEHVEAERGPTHRIVLTPAAPRFDQAVARRLAQKPRIALLCGRYEGIDDRVRESFAHECLSLGDFVLNGGEVAALAIIEAVARLREGVLGNPDSVALESFAERRLGELLEHPQYTRPPDFRGLSVPPALLDGDHANVERWRRRTACRRTWRIRPELRPRRSLAVTTPVWLVSAPGVDGVAALTGAPHLHHLQAKGPGGEGKVVRDDAAGLRHLRKVIKKRTGRVPWLVALEAPSIPAQDPPTRVEPLEDPIRRADELLDLLAVADDEPEGPLERPIALLVGFTTRAGIDAIFAPAPRPPEKNPPDSLAIRTQLIESSRPPSVGGAQLCAVALASLGRTELPRQTDKDLDSP